MAWIESHQTLREHPKVYALMDALGIGKAQAIGHLHLLWWWCVDYSPDGVMKHNDSQIARAGEWTGDSVKFVEAVVAAGFLDRGDGVLTVHDWLEFCGPLIVKRIERKKERQTLSAERQTKIAESVPTVPNRTVPTKPKEKDMRQRRSVFVRPSVEQIGGYCRERRNNINPQQFFDYYESNGWRVGKNHMKDWMATVRTWEKNNFERGGNHANGNTGPKTIHDRLFERERKTSPNRPLENVPIVHGGVEFPSGVPILK